VIQTAKHYHFGGQLTSNIRPHRKESIMPNLPSIHHRRDQIISQLRLIKQRIKGTRTQLPKSDRGPTDLSLQDIEALIASMKRIGTKPPFQQRESNPPVPFLDSDEF
jgi:hypothetical protein